MQPNPEHIEQARGLNQAARQFLLSEPWEHIRESECFAFRDPDTLEQVFVSVRGDLDPCPGLAVFRGVEGYASMHRLGLRAIESLDERDILDVSGTFVVFRPLAELSARAMVPIESSGVEFDPAGLAPDFATYLPGHVPGGPTSEEIRLLTLALRLSCQLVEPVLENKLHLDCVDGRWIEFRHVHDRAACWWEASRTKCGFVQPSLFPPRPQPLDELNRARLQQLAERPDEIWEFDIVPVGMVQELAPEERWPILLMLLIVDRATGMPRHFEYIPAPVRYAQAAARLVSALLSIGARPAQMRVRDYRMRASIAAIAQAMDCKLITVRHLPALDVGHAVLRDLIRRDSAHRAGWARHCTDS